MLAHGWVDPSAYCSDGITFESLAKSYPNYTRVEEVLGVHL